MPSNVTRLESNPPSSIPSGVNATGFQGRRASEARQPGLGQHRRVTVRFRKTNNLDPFTGDKRLIGAGGRLAHGRPPIQPKRAAKMRIQTTSSLKNAVALPVSS